MIRKVLHKMSKLSRRNWRQKVILYDDYVVLLLNLTCGKATGLLFFIFKNGI